MSFDPDDLLTARGRAKLQPREQGDAYFRTLARGQAIGFRPSKSAGSPGTWVARYRDRDTGKLITKSIGEFDTYDAAVKRASELFGQASKGIDVRVKHTVTDACHAYTKSLEGLRPQTAEETRARFERLVYFGEDADTSSTNKDDPRHWFGGIELSRLRREHVERWFASISEDRAPSTANREFRSLRAALNYGLDSRMVADDHAWGIKVHSNSERARVDAYLSKAERRRIIADDTRDGSFAMPELEMRYFCQFLALTGLRPGAVAGLRVRDYDARKQLLAINKDKAGGGRIIQVSDKAAPILKIMAKGQEPDAWLFRVAVQVLVPIEGQAKQRLEWAVLPWRKDLWKDRFKAAATTAADKLAAQAKSLREQGKASEAEELEASASRVRGATVYTLRHSAISDMVEGGLPIHSVAKTCGTSVEMIEAHYGHLSTKTRQVLDSLGY